MSHYFFVYLLDWCFKAVLKNKYYTTSLMEYYTGIPHIVCGSYDISRRIHFFTYPFIWCMLHS